MIPEKLGHLGSDKAGGVRERGQRGGKGRGQIESRAEVGKMRLGLVRTERALRVVQDLNEGEAAPPALTAPPWQETGKWTMIDPPHPLLTSEIIGVPQFQPHLGNILFFACNVRQTSGGLNSDFQKSPP